MISRKKKKAKKSSFTPKKMRTKDLCISLVAIAAFHVEDTAAQAKIYEAVRRLQLLDSAAIKSGILPE